MSVSHPFKYCSCKKERWKHVPGYKGYYLLSDHGRFKRVQTDTILKPTTWGPYKIMELSKNGIRKKFSIHRMVGVLFKKRIIGKNVINHKDCIKFNLCYKNLEWTTSSGNAKHAHNNNRHPHSNRGDNNGRHKISATDVKVIRALAATVDTHMIAKLYGITERHCRSIIDRTYWKNV